MMKEVSLEKVEGLKQGHEDDKEVVKSGREFVLITNRLIPPGSTRHCVAAKSLYATAVVCSLLVTSLIFYSLAFGVGDTLIDDHGDQLKRWVGKPLAGGAVLGGAGTFGLVVCVMLRYFESCCFKSDFDDPSSV